MRSIISYDDIASEAPQDLKDTRSPPKKRRKNNYNNNRGGGSGTQQRHGGGGYIRQQQGGERNPSYEKAELEHSGSRDLLYEEIWDDSALIKAWDAAAEEYEALNGPEKKWKIEPVNKSALWYNVPPPKNDASETPSGPYIPHIPAEFASQFQGEDKDGEEDGQNEEETENSKPLHFSTFVPRHDPSLKPSTEEEETVEQGASSSQWGVVPPPPMLAAGKKVTKDDAFQQAMSSWYWAGYWTAMYHMADKPADTKATSVAKNEGQLDMDVEADADADADGESDGVTEAVRSRTQDDDLIPT